MRGSRRSPSWLERYNDSTATTQDFQAVYEQVSGRDLGEFFDTWLRTPSKPALP
jgi:aminopeptidase N